MAILEVNHGKCRTDKIANFRCRHENTSIPYLCSYFWEGLRDEYTLLTPSIYTILLRNQCWLQRLVGEWFYIRPNVTVTLKEHPVHNFSIYASYTKQEQTQNFLNRWIQNHYSCCFDNIYWTEKLSRENQIVIFNMIHANYYVSFFFS